MKLVRITAVWCMSCILMNEILNKIEAEKKTLYKTIDYDYDNDVEIIANYQIGTILPVYILLDAHDVELDRLVGEKSKQELISFLTTNGGLS